MIQSRKIRPSLVLWCLLGVAPLLNGAPGDWPQWRGPERTGLSSETGLLKEWPAEGPPLLWTAKDIGRGYGSVVIADGKAYVAGTIKGGEGIVCVDIKDGKKLWESVVRKGGDSGRGTPTLDGDRLYTISGRGNQEGDIACLNTADGKIVWQRDFQKDFNGRMQTSWGYSESPLVDGDRVICTPGGKDTIVALNKMTGETIWKSQVPGGEAAAYASIVIMEAGGVKQYVQMLEKGIVGIAAKDGKFLWRYNKVANGTANIPTAIVKGDRIFCSTGYGTGAALLHIQKDSKSGFIAKELKFLPAKDFQNHHGGMVLVGDYIYAGHGHNAGAPVCIEFKTGKIVWKKDRGPGSGSAAVVYADGHVYFRFESTDMVLVEATPDGYKQKGAFKIPGDKPSWQHPVVAGGKLYLRDQGKMFCYDLKAK